MIKKTSPVPAYYQVKMEILENIKSNYWKVGDQLPTEMEFCDMYQVSRITVRRALFDLEGEGYIYHIQGKGSFVKFKEISQSMSKFYSFTDETIKMGYIPSAVFLDLTCLEAPREVSEALNLEEHDRVYLLERLRLADEMIIAYDRSYIPEKLIPNFSKEMLKGGSLYKALEKYYGFVPNNAEETIEAISIEPADAAKMRLRSNSPQLLVKRVAYYNDQKIEFNYRIVNSSIYKYKIKLE